MSTLPDTEESYKSCNSLLPNSEKLRKTLIKENKEYEEKIVLGKQIYKIVGEENIKQGSLNPVFREALDLFMKQKSQIDHHNITLRPWQEELLKCTRKQN